MRARIQIINENGEVIHQQSDVFKVKGAYPAYLSEDGCKIPAHKDGIRMFREVPFPKGMSWSDKGRFSELCRLYLVGDSGVLGCASRGGPRAFNATEIGELVGLNPRQAQKWVKRMCGVRVFLKVQASDKSHQYWVNPAYALKAGHKISLGQFLMFRDELKNLIQPWAFERLNYMAAREPLLMCNIKEETEGIFNEKGT